jgi:pimeloyl-ACP methyl ester carboxylesterase
VPQISDRERKDRDKRRQKEEAALYQPKRSMGKRLWQGFWGMLFILVVVVHAVGGWVYAGRITEGAFEIPPNISFAEVDATFSAAEIEAEQVTYLSPLGEMDAWRTFGANGTWVIHVHGKEGLPTDFLTAVGALDEAGYPQLVVSYRNDPEQPVDPTGIYQHGTTEWQDLEGAVEYARSEGATGIVLSGQSMGGAIVLAYLYRQAPDLISAVVLDSPSLDLTSSIDLAASRERLPGGIPLPPTLTALAIFISSVDTGANIDLMNYLKRDGQLVTQTLVFHGTEDQTVPIETSRRLAEDRPQFVKLVEIPGADHAESDDVDPERFTSTLVAFVNSNS